MSSVAAARETDMPRSCNSASRVSTRPSTQLGFLVIVCLPGGLAVRQLRARPGRRVGAVALHRRADSHPPRCDLRLGLRPSADLRPPSLLPRLAPPWPVTRTASALSIGGRVNVASRWAPSALIAGDRRSARTPVADRRSEQRRGFRTGVVTFESVRLSGGATTRPTTA
jgi:hypothetical protein